MTSSRCDTGAPWYPPTYDTPDCSSALVTARIPSPWKVSPSPRRSDSISLVNCRSTHERPDAVHELVESAGVLDDLGAVERRTKHRRVGVLAAQAAADTA